MLKPCPFCGGAFRVVESAGPNNLTVYHESEDESCPMEAHETWCGPEYLDRYDRRPIEDALTARAEKAERERDDARARLAVVNEAWGRIPRTAWVELEQFLVKRDEARAIDAALSESHALAVVETQIESDGTPCWYEAVACWNGSEDGREIGTPVTVVVLHANAVLERGVDHPTLSEG